MDTVAPWPSSSPAASRRASLRSPVSSGGADNVSEPFSPSEPRLAPLQPVPPARSLAARQAAARSSAISYAVEELRPPKPELRLPAASKAAWRRRVAEVGGALCTSREALAEADAVELPMPPLCWYGAELQRVCGQALVSMAGSLGSLQAWHCEQPAMLSTNGQLWPLLLEVSTLFGAAACHARAALEALSEAAATAGGHAPAGLRHWSAARTGTGRGAAPPTAPSPRPGQSAAAAAAPAGSAGAEGQAAFTPRCAQVALAGLHIDVAKLQVHGSPLGAGLRLLDPSSGAVASRTGDLLRRILGAVAEAVDDAGQEKGRLFLLVPCLELAAERFGALLRLAGQWRTAAGPEEGAMLAGGVVASVELKEEKVAEVGADITVVQESRMSNISNAFGNIETTSVASSGGLEGAEGRHSQQLDGMRGETEGLLSPRPSSRTRSLGLSPASSRRPNSSSPRAGSKAS